MDRSLLGRCASTSGRSVIPATMRKTAAAAAVPALSPTMSSSSSSSLLRRDQANSAERAFAFGRRGRPSTVVVAAAASSEGNSDAVPPTAKKPVAPQRKNSPVAKQQKQQQQPQKKQAAAAAVGAVGAASAASAASTSTTTSKAEAGAGAGAGAGAATAPAAPAAAPASPAPPKAASASASAPTAITPSPKPSPSSPTSSSDRHAAVEPGRVRNFSIIAHIDHGKSTLADVLLARTGTVAERDMQAQFLDGMDLERERGITIKLNSARMRYRSTSSFEGGEGGGGGGGEGGEKGSEASEETEYALNLIDTPGHVDFSYEVSRSLAACEGALLVVDASQGVEAQTLANVYLALEAGLEIIPVLNKIDLPGADPERVRREIEEVIGLDASEAILASAKMGVGVEEILEAVVRRVPPPADNRDRPLRALIFDSYYDAYRGVIVYFRVVDGSLSAGDVIKLMNTGKEHVVDEVGVLCPDKVPCERLQAGDVGYLAASIKSVADARVGDTITLKKRPAKEALPGYQEATPMVFCGLFPTDAGAFPDLREALGKLQLNDAALRFEPEVSPAMGFGFRCGFLGLLHGEIIQERLEREYNLDLIATAPTVAYRVKLPSAGRHAGGSAAAAAASAKARGAPAPPSADSSASASSSPSSSSSSNSPLIVINNDEIDDPLLIPIDNPASVPDARDWIEEPYVRMEIITPKDYVGTLMELAQNRRGEFIDMRFLTEARTTLLYDVPLAEVVTDFFDELKSRSRGFASMEYSVTGYRKSDLVRLDVKINNEVAEPLAAIVHRDNAYRIGRALCKKLKELIPRQQFKIPIQAAIGSRVIASESISALRKDVLSKCYGGDVTRKKKLLKKQAEGKKRMKNIGSVNVPQAAFMAVLNVKPEDD